MFEILLRWARDPDIRDVLTLLYSTSGFVVGIAGLVFGYKRHWELKELHSKTTAKQDDLINKQDEMAASQEKFNNIVLATIERGVRDDPSTSAAKIPDKFASNATYSETLSKPPPSEVMLDAERHHPATSAAPSEADKSANLDDTESIETPDNSEISPPDMSHMTDDVLGYDNMELVADVADLDEAVQETVDTISSMNFRYFEKVGAAEIGDRLSLKGECWVRFGGAWTPCEEGNIELHEKILGADEQKLLPELEEGLVGVVAGERASILVTFPAEYHIKKLAGKKARYRIDVASVEERRAVPLDDQAVIDRGYRNLDQFRETIRPQVMNLLVLATNQRLKRRLLDKLEEANSESFKPLPALVDAEQENLWRAQMRELKTRGLTKEALGKPDAEIKAEFKALAERRVRLAYIFAAIAREKGIKVTAADLQARVEDLATAPGADGDAIRTHFSNPEKLKELRGPLLEDKVTQWLLSKDRPSPATIKTTMVPAADLLSELD